MNEWTNDLEHKKYFVVGECFNISQLVGNEHENADCVIYCGGECGKVTQVETETRSRCSRSQDKGSCGE